MVLIAMVQSVVTVSPWCPRGLVTLMVHRMTVPAPDTPIAVKTPVHVAVEILLAGVSGAVAAGAAAVLTLRMRVSASLGVAGGVAVTGAAATLGVDVGRRRPWQ